jgi:hypothetical protein
MLQQLRSEGAMRQLELRTPELPTHPEERPVPASTGRSSRKSFGPAATIIAQVRLIE